MKQRLIGREKPRTKWIPRRAAVALGADGVMIEVQPDPARTLSDGPQSLRIDRFTTLMGELRKIADVVGRSRG